MAVTIAGPVPRSDGDRDDREQVGRRARRRRPSASRSGDRRHAEREARRDDRDRPRRRERRRSDARTRRSRCRGVVGDSAPPRTIRRASRLTRTNSVKWRHGWMWLGSPA